MKNRALKITFLVSVFFISFLYPQEFSVSSGKPNLIKFLAKSTFKNFSGTTSAVEGFIRLDSTQAGSGNFEFKVYLDSLDTGIGLRNTHMREKYLQTNQNPFAQFTGRITGGFLKSNPDSIVSAEGTLKIHGVEKQKRIKARIYDYGNIFKLESSFTLSLSDFNIEQPSFLFNTVANEIVLECTIYLERQKKF